MDGDLGTLPEKNTDLNPETDKTLDNTGNLKD